MNKYTTLINIIKGFKKKVQTYRVNKNNVAYKMPKGNRIISKTNPCAFSINIKAIY